MIANFLKKRICIAIELGYSAIKGVRVCSSRKIIDACAIIPFSSFTEYPYDDPDIVLPPLNSLRDKLGAKGKRVRLCVNMSHITVRELRVPVVPEDEMEEVVKWELKKVIDYDPDIYNMDFKVIENVLVDNVEKYLVKVYVARKKILKQYVSLIEQADMGVDSITIPPYALRALFIELFGDVSGNFAIIDLGAKSSTLSIVKNKIVRFERQLIFSSFELADILEKKGVALHTMDELSSGYRIGDESAIDEGIVDALNSLVEELSKSFNYFSSVIKGGNITKILLTGGLANLNGIDAFIADKTGVYTEILNPFTVFQCNDVTIDPLRISVALGSGLLR